MEIALDILTLASLLEDYLLSPLNEIFGYGVVLGDCFWLGSGDILGDYSFKIS